MQSTKYGASEGAKSKWADVEVAEYQPGGGHVGDNLQQFKRTVLLIFFSPNALSLSKKWADKGNVCYQIGDRSVSQLTIASTQTVSLDKQLSVRFVPQILNFSM